MVTIDEIHREIMHEFEESRTSAIPKLKREIQDIEAKIEMLESRMLLKSNGSKKLENNHIDMLLELKDTLDENKTKLRGLKRQETDYFLNNSKFIFNYFENKKNISAGKGNQNTDKVNFFFKLKSKPTTTTTTTITKNHDDDHDDGLVGLGSDDNVRPCHHSSNPANPSDEKIPSSASSSASSLSPASKYFQYWQNIHSEYHHMLLKDHTEDHKPMTANLKHNFMTLNNLASIKESRELCSNCEVGELIAHEEEGMLICNNVQCGNCLKYMFDNVKPMNKDPPNEVSFTAYIRLNHFKEILSQFQAKETTQIPEHIIELIRARIKKERITDFKKTLTYTKMREILRKLGLNKYFEHAQYINSLFGIKPPVMSVELYQTLCILFIEIQHPYTIHCPANRTNFFNYTYTFYQLCVLLDQTQYLPFIPLLKDRQKQLDQDLIWCNICKELDWEFIPTV